MYSRDCEADLSPAQGGLWEQALNATTPSTNRMPSHHSIRLDRIRTIGVMETNDDAGNVYSSQNGIGQGGQRREAKLGSIFQQFAQQLSSIPARDLRLPSQPFSVNFVGEPGIDAGGVFRDALSAICAELQSSSEGKTTSLLIPCANRVNKVGHTLDKFVPNALCTSAEALMQFEMLGRLMGIAVRVRNRSAGPAHNRLEAPRGNDTGHY